MPVSKNYETKIILNRAFLQKEKEQYGVYCSFEINNLTVFCLFLNIKSIIGLESPKVRTFTTVRTSEYLMLRFLNILSGIITSITNEAMAQANRAIKPMIPISSSKQKNRTATVAIERFSTPSIMPKALFPAILPRRYLL